jgi:hypothetical protein
MPEQADVFRAWRAQQNMIPGTAMNGHAQAPQTASAAITLIQNHRPQQPGRDQRVNHHHRREKKIVPEQALVKVNIQSGHQHPDASFEQDQNRRHTDQFRD